jgi:ribosomal protein L11 methyltransferase
MTSDLAPPPTWSGSIATERDSVVSIDRPEVHELVVTVPPSAVELVADALLAAGARGVEERRAGAPAGSGGLVEVRAVLGEDPALLADVAGSLPGAPSWRIEEVDPMPAETWRQHVGPVEVVDGLVVTPAWIDVGDGTGTPPATTVVRIEPGAAFGLGDHPTTQLVLAQLVRELAARPGAVVADIGCGSGVLAISAALLGARAVRAVDVSPAAVEATLDNAERNRVADVVEVDRAAVRELAGPYDVVLANILAPTLVVLADDLRRLTATDGVLIVSGVLAGRYAHVVGALSPLQVASVSEAAGWAALALRHPAAS